MVKVTWYADSDPNLTPNPGITIVLSPEPDAALGENGEPASSLTSSSSSLQVETNAEADGNA